MDKIRLGVSACLLGQPVRYDGGHKLDRYVTDILGAYVEYVPVCPEVECGMGIPRESMHLEGDPENPRLITTRTRRDVTDQMLGWATQRLEELKNENLCGFIFKSNSPSSGMERVKIFDGKGMPQKKGVGVFAGLFMKAFPYLPVEEEGRLRDEVLRENFVERIFHRKRWHDHVREGKDLGRLVQFHTDHKLLYMAHSPKHHRELGKLVAEGKSLPLDILYQRYEELMTEALKLKATVKKNTNVLFHLMGFFKKDLSPSEKEELREIIEAYYRGIYPLIVPITLINHYVRKYDQPYLKRQVYLNPHPLELKLRNHA
ncbi:MAG: DUF523 and DUF1722 domain-containing protein [Desulfosoma sp.]